MPTGKTRVATNERQVGAYTRWSAAVNYLMKTGPANRLRFARLDNAPDRPAYSATSILTQTAPGKSHMPGRSINLGLQAALLKHATAPKFSEAHRQVKHDASSAPAVDSLVAASRGEMSQHRTSPYVPALGFRWLTPAYDVVVRATTRERTFKLALIEQATFAPGQQTLDLACGTGTLAVWIKQRFPEVMVTGVDGDTDVLSIASRKAKEAKVSIRFDHGLSLGLPYPDAHFDRILSSLFFHHLSWDDKQRTAHELFRVMRPSGELHVADWGRARGPLMRGAFLFIQLLDGFKNTQDNVEGKLPELFRGAGFTNVLERRTFSTIFGTMALYSAVKAANSTLNPDAELAAL